MIAVLEEWTIVLTDLTKAYVSFNRFQQTCFLKKSHSAIKYSPIDFFRKHNTV